MAEQTADKNLPVVGMDVRKIVEVPVVGATSFTKAHTIYNNAPVASDINVALGYAHAVGTGITWATGDVFFGIAMGHVVVTAADTANGTFKISVAQDGKWPWAIASLTQADVGKLVYLTDDGAIQSSSTNALCVGRLSWVDSTYAWVDIEPAAGKAQA